MRYNHVNLIFKEEKIIYGTFEKGDIRSIETVTDDEVKAKN